MFTKLTYTYVGLCIMVLSLVGCQNLKPTDRVRLTHKAPTLSCHSSMPCNIVRIDGVATGGAAVQLTSTTLSAGTHQIEIEFGSAAHHHFEQFKFTHDFVRGHRYDVTTYRELNEGENNLLSAALPSKLCIKLLEDNRIIRKFCRNIEDAKPTKQFKEQSTTQAGLKPN